MIDIVILSFICYVLIPSIFLLGGAERCEQIIDQRSSTTIKGVFAIYLVIHHFVQKIWERSFLEPMAWFGFVIVGWFFLTSGYGIVVSYERKGLSGFWKKKIHRIWLPFFIAVTVEGILKNIFLQEETQLLCIIYYAASLRTSNGSFMWYVFTQIIMYCCFYLPFRFVQNPKLRIVTMFVLIACFDAINIFTGQPDYKWVTCLCFPFGVLIRLYQEQIRKNLVIFQSRGVEIVATCIFIGISLALGWRHARWEVFFLIPLAECALAIICSKYLLQSRIFYWLGKISFEIYITQYTVIVIGIAYLGIRWYVLLLSVMASVIFAVCVRKASNIVITIWEQIRAVKLFKV